MRLIRRFISQRDVSKIIRLHFHSVKFPTNGHALPSEPPKFCIKLLVVELFIPVLFGLLTSVTCHAFLKELASVLVLVCGIFSAFLFQVSIQMLIRSAAWRIKSEDQFDDKYRYGVLLHNLAANSSYASIISATCAISAIFAGISSYSWIECLLTGLTVGLFTHLILTFILVLVRLFLITRGQIISVYTNS